MSRVVTPEELRTLRGVDPRAIEHLGRVGQSGSLRHCDGGSQPRAIEHLGRVGQSGPFVAPGGIDLERFGAWVAAHGYTVVDGAPEPICSSTRLR